MFKKEPVQERSKSLLKNKDIRTFRQALISAFPRLSGGSDATKDANPLADAPFLDKSQVSSSKLGSHGVLYSSPEGPIAFEPRDGDIPGIVPSLYFLSLYPHALRRIEIHSPVSEYILNGADLMLPGVVSYECLRDIELKECVSVAVQGNPIPFAVGLSTVSWEGVQHNGLRGKGVRILHVFGDFLCHKWNRNAPLNEGFSLTRIRPTEPIPSEVDEIADEVADIDLVPEGNEPPTSEGGASEAVPSEPVVADNDDEAVIGAFVGSVAAIESEGIEVDDVVEEDAEELNAEASGDGKSSLTADEKRVLMDGLLERCLLRAFHYIIKDKFLPVLVSSIWAILLKCYVAEESAPDIKKSSHRKVSSFLQRYESLGLIKTRDDAGVSSILSVQRDHPLFRQPEYRVADAEAFRNAVSQRGQVASEENVAKQRTNGINSGAAAKGGEHAINVVELFKLPKPFVDVFGNVEGEYGRFLTPSEARNLLLGYISEQNFEAADKGASISVPPNVPLYKLLKLSKYGEKETRPSQPSVASSSVLAPSGSSKPSRGSVDEEEEEIYPIEDFSTATGAPRIVAGVMVSSVSDLVRSSQTQSKPAPGKKEPTKKDSSMLNQSSKISVYNPAKKAAVSTGAVAAPVAPPPVPIEPVAKEPANAVISKKDVVKEFVQKLTPYYAVVNKRGEYHVMSGSIPQVNIEVEKRAGNKLVTRLSGLEPFEIDGDALGKDCQKKFACSTSYTAIDARPGKSELVLQGLHVDDLTELLVRDYGLPKTIIESHLGKGVKAKGSRR